MPTRSSGLIRVLTVMFSLGILAILVVQASMTAGCGGAESSGTKSPEQTTNPAAPEANPPPSSGSASGQEIQVAPPHFGGSKSGAILWPEEKQDQQGKRLNPPPSNVNAKR